MKLKLTAIFLVLFAYATSAQEKKWTLAECIQYAEENNLTIAQYELDLESVYIDESDAFGNFLPDANAQLSSSANTGLSFDPTNNQPVTTTILTASGGVTSTVSIFNGLRNINRLRRAKMNSLANQYRLDDLKDDIRLAVANAYLNIISNKEVLITQKGQYAVTEQDLKRITELVEAGVVPRGDLLEIEATAAGLEQQIVNTENLVLISRINLAQLLQITDYENFDVAEIEIEVPPSEVLNKTPKEIFATALTFRNDIKFSESGVTLAEQDLKISKGALLPTLGAFFNYNTRYSDQENFNNITGLLERDSFKDQLWLNDGISYGVQLNVPIFNRFINKNNIRRSEINVQRAQLQLEQDKLVLETSINQAYVDVKSFAKAYEAAQKTLDATRLAYNYSKEKFDVGLMNAFDFSQAQSRVDNAEADVVRTKYDYIFRLKVLEFYFGIPIDLN
ncbi:TolC family protein [Aurantibacter crassamenti]|uniref:TolC family protein n=1 Tax=Aurantibacter crassamenti TaxID=1837375 RepID=UPI00193A62A0|nr:TolC family protein [Aurantibacter crassamenti]MBM1106010.1 TolC family protein [Aurantibacter crassamenti]